MKFDIEKVFNAFFQVCVFTDPSKKVADGTHGHKRN